MRAETAAMACSAQAEGTESIPSIEVLVTILHEACCFFSGYKRHRSREEQSGVPGKCNQHMRAEVRQKH